jgi:molybdopterin molybdotransferase
VGLKVEEKMLTNILVEDANKIIANECINIQAIGLPILDSLDYVLAEDIESDINIPPFNRSPLDGYAYRSEDTLEATKDSPITLEVIDNIQAGYVSNKKIEKGQAVRIMTGAKIPKGADVIIRYEDTEFTNKEVKIFKSLSPQSNIVKMGEDVEIGDVILRQGMTIGPAEIGILASLGRNYVRVYAKPRVAILATGDELLNIDDRLEEGKIRDSNSYSIAAQVKKLGGEAIILGTVKDDKDAIKEKIELSLKSADMIITTGGASVGDSDLIKDVFLEMGAKILFWKVRMKPGSPMVVAKYEDKFLFGLSGNPAASYITFEEFVRPTILTLMGKENHKMMEVSSILEDDFNKVRNQDRYVRAFTYKKEGRYYTKLPDNHSSGILSSLCGKNSLFLVAGGTGPYKKGDKIKVELIDYLEVE